MTVAGDHRRSRRVSELLRTYLSEALARDVADPRLSGLIVTGVDVTDDLGLARVHVRLLAGDTDPARRGAALKALARVAARLRRGLAPRLGLRRVPELSFDYDTGPDHTQRVEELLHEIEKERGEKS
jgi:ribosome-binding factor A